MKYSGYKKSNQKLYKKLWKVVFSGALFSIFALPTINSQAELITKGTTDIETGRANLVVSDDEKSPLPPAQLGISPARVDEKVSLINNKNISGLNQSLTLYNYGTKPKKIKLTLVDVDESGKPTEPNETTLKPWTLINPTQFVIDEKGYQTVRLSIRPPKDFALGKHRAMIVIEQQIDNPLTYDADGKGVTVEIGSHYGLPINIDIE